MTHLEEKPQATEKEPEENTSDSDESSVSAADSASKLEYKPGDTSNEDEEESTSSKVSAKNVEE